MQKHIDCRLVGHWKLKLIKIRGQWPCSTCVEPISMQWTVMWLANGLLFNILQIYFTVPEVGVKPGPLALKSNVLTTRLCRRQGLYHYYVSLLWMIIKIWPRRLTVASEVTFDLRNELRDLDYICSSAYMLSLSLKRLFSPRRKEEETKMTCWPACSYLAAGKK